MSTPGKFPTDLLSQPIQARWTYFQQKIVAHPRLMAVHQSLMQAIRYATNGRLILVFGPTGVGKTTLRRGIERALIEVLLSALAQDPGRIPVASLEAVSPERGQFDWQDFYTRALIALNEPLIQHKLAPGNELAWDAAGVQCNEHGQLVMSSKLTVGKLRRALESCLRHRRPAAFIIDEAQHLQKIAGGRRLRDQMDAIKSLAERSGTVHVLIGTYELLNLTNLSDQLSRRSYPIPFSRYRADEEADRKAFKGVIRTFQDHLPLPESPDLVGQWDYLYEYAAGCVGILKVWLCDALAAALERGEKTITHQQLKRHAMSPDRLMNIIREMREGERKMAEGEGQRSQIRQALGLEPKPPSNQPTTTSKPRSGPVATRKPKRDPIGGQPHD
jgi:energy-coupling factor transporter ATP-binding protein EcfA2